MSHHDWTTTFFNGLAVEFWIKVAPQPSQTEIDFLRSTFTGKDILDLACGAGRYTIPLSAAGYRLTGVDISAEFLAVAAARGPNIEWHRGDIRDLPWIKRFDGALCFGNSFAYFDRRGTLRFLNGLRRALRSEASFVLETAALAESLLPSLQQRRWMEVDDILFFSSSRYEAKQSRLDIEYSLVKGSRRETKNAQSWIYTTREVTDMLYESGFEVLDIYGSAAGETFALGSPRAIFVTRCIRG